jgi:hypothetical protein
MVDSWQAEPAMQGGVGRDRKRVGAPGGRVPAAVSFLEAALAGGAVGSPSLRFRPEQRGWLGSVSGSATRRPSRSWAFVDSLTIDPAETVADITPQVPTSVIYADHSRPERSGNPDQTKSAGVVSTSIQPMPIRRVPLEWLAGVASPGGADLGHLCGPFTTRAERQPRSMGVVLSWALLDSLADITPEVPTSSSMRTIHDPSGAVTPIRGTESA